MKKLILHSETIYIAALLMLSLAVAMISCTDYGVSMVVAPAYILSLKFPQYLTFGQAEYIIQGILFAVFCILVRRVKPVYLTSFLTGLIYGVILDMWRAVVPVFNPNITEPGSLAALTEIIFFGTGMLLTAVSIAFMFRTYLYPQVYDFFVKGISEKFSLNIGKFKSLYDAASLTVSVVMTLLMFGSFRGIGFGTVILTVFNGIIINAAGKVIDRYFVIKPMFPSFSKKFDI